MMKKKRPYLLLELMITLFIVSSACLPLVRAPMASLYSQLSVLQQIELERLAEVDFANIKADLFKNEISWAQVLNADSHLLYSQKKVNLDLTEKSDPSFEEKIYIYAKGHKRDKELKDYISVHIKILFEPIPYKKPLSGEKPLSFKHILFVQSSA
jgi:hypothetical protein